MNAPSFEIVRKTSRFILIRDMGPWDDHPTITNAAEEVVGALVPTLDGRHLYYIDSEGDLGELIIENGKFARFGNATREQLD